MTSRTARSRLLNLLLCALVALGVVAMHHLSGGGHLSGHVTSTGPSQAAGDLHQPMRGVSSDDTRDRAVHTVTASTAGTSWTALAADAPLLEMCLAVLLAGLLIVAVTPRSPRWRPRAADQPRAALSASLGRDPPRLLLARLCVLRI